MIDSNAPVYGVAVYLCDRAYGGSEEGGWWYDHGFPVAFARSFSSEQAALKYYARLRRVAKRANRGRRSINSVLSDGEFRAVISDGMPAEFPTQRPWFE